MIAILGSGAFGTALAISLGAKTNVLLWSRSKSHALEMETTRKNDQRLPGAVIPESVSVSAELANIPDAAPILLAVPMQQLNNIAEAHKDALRGHDLVACCKGVDLSSGLGPTGVLNSVLPDATTAILTGPSFAADIAKGLPTALTLACQDSAICADLQKQLTTPNLRIYRTTDTTGAELGGALKNVIAIAAGAVIGAGLGDSARAALMTRGYAEMQRMAVRLGAKPETLAGLSGFGDLTLTCTSDLSRNYRFGVALGQNRKFDPTVTVEGAATARAVLQRASALKIDMPITQSVVALLDGKLDLTTAMDSLLTRPLKEE